MKRYLTLLLAAVMLVTVFAGCSKKEPETAQTVVEEENQIDPNVLKQAASVEVTFNNVNYATGEGVYYFNDNDMNKVRLVFSNKDYSLSKNYERDEKQELHKLTFYDKDGGVLLQFHVGPSGWLFLDDGTRFVCEDLEEITAMAMQVIQHQREESLEASASVPNA